MKSYRFNVHMTALCIDRLQIAVDSLLYQSKSIWIAGNGCRCQTIYKKNTNTQLGFFRDEVSIRNVAHFRVNGLCLETKQKWLKSCVTLNW